MVAAAAIVAATLGHWWTVRTERLDAWRVAWAILLIATATFAGGRLHFVLANWAQFEDHPWLALRFSSGALHAPGALAAGTLAGVIVLPLLRLPTGRFVDGLAPAVGVGIALARVGCFLHGCCYGGVCPYPWGISLPKDSYTFNSQLEARLLDPDAARSLPIHPLPLYFAAVALAITAFLLWLRPRKRYHGELGLVLLVAFSASSALLEPIRADDALRVYWGQWPQLLWICAGMAVASLLLLGVAEYAARSKPG